jgi:hypothetical protein
MRRFSSPAVSVVFGVILLVLGVTIQGYAFTPPNAVGIGLGGELGTTPRGPEAVNWNPAFLGFDDNPRFGIMPPLLNFGARFSNDSYSISMINRHFQSGNKLDSLDKIELLDNIKGDAVSIRSDAFVPGIGFSFPATYLNLSLNYDVFSATDVMIDKDVFDLGLFGNPVENFGQTRNFENLATETVTISRISFTGAKRFEELGFVENNDWLDEFTAGMTFSYFLGHYYLNIEEASAQMYTNWGEFDGSGLFKIVSATSGSGVGLDMGIAAKFMNRRGTFGLSIVNILNKVNWTGAERGIHSFDTEFHPYYEKYLTEPVILPGPYLGGMEDTEKWIEDNFQRVDSTETNQDITSELPRSILISGGWWLREGALITGSIRQGLNETAGNRKLPTVSTGFEYMFHPMVPVRSGFGYNPRGGFTWGFGAGIRWGTWRSDFGFGYENGIMNLSKGLMMAFNTTFMIDKPTSDPFKTNLYWQRESDKLKDVIESGNAGQSELDIAPRPMLEDVEGTGKVEKISPDKTLKPVFPPEEIKEETSPEKEKEDDKTTKTAPEKPAKKKKVKKKKNPN